MFDQALRLLNGFTFGFARGFVLSCFAMFTRQGRYGYFQRFRYRFNQTSIVVVRVVGALSSAYRAATVDDDGAATEDTLAHPCRFRQRTPLVTHAIAFRTDRVVIRRDDDFIDLENDRCHSFCL